jgi:hypothetical protein
VNKAARYQLRKIWRRYFFKRRIRPSLITPPTEESRIIAAGLQRNLALCDWQPHPRYSVFTQYDAGYYTALRAEYLRKYRSFWAVSRTLAPRRIIELGTQAGAGADAYLSATPDAQYLGIDLFGEGVRDEVTGAPWDPHAIAGALLGERGFSYRLLKANLRDLAALPEKADFVAVDAAHDVVNEYADLRLALSADPQWIFVDDVGDWKSAGTAVARFLEHDLRGRLAYTLPVDYIDMGLIIRLAPAPA